MPPIVSPVSKTTSRDKLAIKMTSQHPTRALAPDADPTVRIVIIDDNAGSLKLLSTALARDGLRIMTAQDPEEGLDIVFREHPDIVLTDLVMPGITGLEVLDRVVEFDPAIDVILMTAHYTSESAVEAIRRAHPIT